MALPHPRVLLLCCGAALCAQAEPGGAATGATTATLPDLGPPAAVPDGAPPLLAAIDREDLRRHAYWLADDAREGRYTSGRGQQATAKYVADHFKRLGLEPLGDRRGFLQTYPLQRQYLDGATSLSFAGTRITTHFAVLPGKDDKVTVNGRFVFCGKGRADEVPAELAGRLPVVALDRVPRGQGAGADVTAVQLYRDLARRLGAAGAAAGVVALREDPGAFGNTLNYHALLPDHPRLRVSGSFEPMPVPLFVVAGEGAAALLDHLGVRAGEDGQPAADAAAAGGKSTGKLQIVVKSDDKGSAANVVAVLRGTDRKREAVVFSAHHDHVGQRLDGDAFNGADDNASGTSGLLEIAAAFAGSKDRPSRSIVFLSVSGEELGLWGSQWFVDHPAWPLDAIAADVNVDMIGRAAAAGDGGTALQVTPSKDHAQYSTLVREASRRAKAFGIVLSSGDAYFERSDHVNFARKGIPVVFFCDGEHPDYHQVTDHADRLDYPRMEAVARLAAWTGWLAAEAKGRPETLGPQADW